MTKHVTLYLRGFRTDVDMDESCSIGRTVCSKGESIAPVVDETKTSDKEEEAEDNDDDLGVFKDPMEITKGITKDFRKKLAERSRSSSSAPDDSLLSTSFLEGGGMESDSVFLYSTKKNPESTEQGAAAPERMMAIKELLKPKPADFSYVWDKGVLHKGHCVET